MLIDTILTIFIAVLEQIFNLVAEHQPGYSNKNLAFVPFEVSTHQGERERLIATTLCSYTGSKQVFHVSVSYEAKVRKAEHNSGV